MWNKKTKEVCKIGNGDFSMKKYEITFNQLVMRSSNIVPKKSSKSFVNIWSKFKNGKNRKKIPDTGILSGTLDNNVVTIMSARSIPKTSKIIHASNKISKSLPKSKAMDENVNFVVATKEYGGKYIDDMRMKDCKLSDTTDNLCQSDGNLIHQLHHTAPRKLHKRSKIPRRRTKHHIKPNAARSVQSLRKQIQEQSSVPESAAINAANVKNVPCEEIENKSSLDKIETLPTIESVEFDSLDQISREGKTPEESSIHSSINLPNCISESLNREQVRSSPQEYIGDSSENSSDWGELDTSENDSNPSIRRKIFRRESSRRVCPSSQLNTASTGIASVKSLYSEKYNFFDAIFDIMCWPLLFLKAEE